VSLFSGGLWFVLTLVVSAIVQPEEAKAHDTGEAFRLPNDNRFATKFSAATWSALEGVVVFSPAPNEDRAFFAPYLVETQGRDFVRLPRNGTLRTYRKWLINRAFSVVRENVILGWRDRKILPTDIVQHMLGRCMTPVRPYWLEVPGDSGFQISKSNGDYPHFFQEYCGSVPVNRDFGLLIHDASLSDRNSGLPLVDNNLLLSKPSLEGYRHECSYPQKGYAVYVEAVWLIACCGTAWGTYYLAGLFYWLQTRRKAVPLNGVSLRPNSEDDE
jgi:hypothetical protein